MSVERKSGIDRRKGEEKDHFKIKLHCITTTAAPVGACGVCYLHEAYSSLIELRRALKDLHP